jgi:autotransporter-associated beta strand protein
VAFPCSVSLAGRNSSVVPIEALWGSSNAIAGGLTLTGGGTNYWLQADSATLYIGGTISAGASATGNRTLTLQGVGTFSISASIQNGSASALSLLKTNSGALTLSGANTYTGGTTNYRGNLFLNGSLAGPLTMNSGYLSGTGSAAGATTLNAGCDLSPGTAIANSIGSLSFGSSLTLAAGSTTVIELNAASHTNDVLNVAGALNCGGTLYVANMSGTLAAGQSFQLFNAGSIAGNFSALTLPPLAAGLAWNTNNLSSGAISIIAVSPPETLAMTNLGNGQLQLNWDYGMLQCATNITGPYDTLTNVTSPYLVPITNAQMFYRIQEQ